MNERISPALYHIGVQHIASFLRLNEEEAITKRLRQKVDRIGNEVSNSNWVTSLTGEQRGQLP